MKLTLTQTVATAERISRETGAMHVSSIDEYNGVLAHIASGRDVVGQIGIMHWMPETGKGTDLWLDPDIPGATFLTFHCAENVKEHGIYGDAWDALTRASGGMDVLRKAYGEIDRPALCFIPNREDAETFSAKTNCMIVSAASDLPEMLKHLENGGSAVASPNQLSTGFRLPEGAQVMIHKSLIPNRALCAQLMGREYRSLLQFEDRLHRAEWPLVDSVWLHLRERIRHAEQPLESLDPFLDQDESPAP